MAPPDMRCPFGDWRLSAGWISIPSPLRRAQRRVAIQQAWERLPEEQRADPRWDCDNHGTWNP
jgi:hypothetical protein